MKSDLLEQRGSGKTSPKLFIRLLFARLFWTRANRGLPSLCLSACLILLPESRGPGAQKENDARTFFDSTNLVTFQVDLGDSALRQLEQNPRNYVEGRVSAGTLTYESVGIRLKGTGTFQPIQAHPSLTLKFNWKQPHQHFAGLTKLFLENSGQDATRLCKFIANAAFADGGIPAPRITQARVQLNGRNLGRYVVSEAINKEFLNNHFGNAEGQLYEAEFQDITSTLKQSNGPPGDQSDLRALCSAATLGDRAERKHALGNLLQIDEFLDFFAIEMILANWDGYVLQQNNYRLYHDPVSGRFSIIPHDLDNTLAESGMCLMPPRKGVLTTALLDTPEDREQFRQRVAALVPKVLNPDHILTRILSAVARLKQGATEAEAATIDRQSALLQTRIEERLLHVRQELNGTRPASPIFDSNGMASLHGWFAKTDWNNSSVRSLAENEKACLFIQAANGYCFGSWRLPVWLPAGNYRIEGLARTRDVLGLPSRTGSGAGVRIVGNRRGSGIRDTSDWLPVHHNFVVQDGCEWVELIAELRAYHGSAWFDAESLKLKKLGVKP